MKQFIKFGTIGSVGFLIDASILLLCVNVFSLTLELSRVFSFLTAVFFTWLLNRKYTFSKNNNISKKKEYSYYLLIKLFGTFLNYLIFISLIKYDEIFSKYYILALAIASVIAMFFNYYFIKRKVFN